MAETEFKLVTCTRALALSGFRKLAPITNKNTAACRAIRNLLLLTLLPWNVEQQGAAAEEEWIST